MNAIAGKDFLLCVDEEHAEETIGQIRLGLMAGRLAPFLGPAIMALADEPQSAPASPKAVAAALHARGPAPSSIRSNMWSVAQYIEQRRHRKTLKAWMADIFSAAPQPTELHRWLAKLPLPLIVDSWYDGAMRAALIEQGREDVVNVQGITRALEHADIWTRAYGLGAAQVDAVDIDGATTVLYEPHGGARPAGNFLVADSDYVEVLTEIDIQTPIPDVVKARRGALGFVFLGCRFDDQMLRTYARQIGKRSAGPHFAVMRSDLLTKNERRFLADHDILLLDMPLDHFVRRLVG